MRILALIVVTVLAAAPFVVPQPAEPVPRAPDAAAPAPYAVCPLGEAARRSTVLTFVGGGAGDVTTNVFSGGEIRATEDVAMSESGTGALELSEVTGLARAPVLIGLDDPARSIETVLTGAGIAASACQVGSADTQIVLGGATGEGQTYTIVLSNPFAGSATVDIRAASEVGAESDPALEGVVIPPRSVVPVELNNLLPGRQSMSAAVVTSRGRVVVAALHETGDDASAMGALEPALDWYLPVPGIEGTGRALIVHNPGTAEVPIQVDVYGRDGLVEAAHEAVVPAQGEIVVPAGDLLRGAGGLRVLAAGPVAVGLRLAGEAGRSVAPGVTTPAPSWLLPGAGRAGDSRVHVFNPGQVDVTASLLAGTGKEIETFDVPALSMVGVPLPARGVGARLEADGNVVVHWTTPAEGGLAGDAARAPPG